MFSSIMDLYNSIIQHLSGGDPVAKGLVTVWLLSTLGYISRKLPEKLMDFIEHHTTVNMEFSSNGSNGSDSMMFFYIENWLIANSRWDVRSLAHVSIDSKKEKLLSFSEGDHFVLVGLRLYKVNKREITTKSNSAPEFRLSVTTIGRDISIFTKIIERNKVRDNIRYYYTQADSYGCALWDQTDVIEGINKIFLSDSVKEEIDRNVIFFRDNREWFLKHNFPYKLTIVLYGQPGTGKTSLIRYISDLLNSDIHSLNLASIRAELFERAMRESRPGITRVICIEDFEYYAKKRKVDTKEEEEVEAEENRSRNEMSLDVILNTLQGIHPLENVVTVLTTNHIDKVDEALTRSGRTDVLLEVGPLSGKQVLQYYEYNYELRFPLRSEQVKDIKACDMYELFRNNPRSPEGFIDQLKREGYVNNTVLEKQDSEESVCDCITL